MFFKYSFTSFDELLSSCEVDAISNTTPDSFHKEIAIKSLRNNKHIFSEKPLATNYSDALEMYEETTKKKLINMVNFSYRNSSGYQELAKIVQSGELGSVRHVEAVYYLSWLTSKNQGDWKVDDHLKWRLSTKHGSLGVLGDTGVHIIDFATYPVGRLKKINTLLKTFKDKGEKLGEMTITIPGKKPIVNPLVAEIEVTKIHPFARIFAAIKYLVFGTSLDEI